MVGWEGAFTQEICVIVCEFQGTVTVSGGGGGGGTSQGTLLYKFDAIGTRPGHVIIMGPFKYTWTGIPWM